MAGRVLSRLVALAIHLEIAVAIWQSRLLVGRWIGGKTGATGTFASFRRGFGRVWYIPALFYILALWIALAAGVHNAFFVLLRIVLVVAAAAVIGRMAWRGSATLLARAFPDPSATDVQRPALFARAHAYHPLIRGLIQTVIGILVVILTLQGWGVDAFGWLFNNSLSRSLIDAFHLHRHHHRHRARAVGMGQRLYEWPDRAALKYRAGAPGLAAADPAADAQSHDRGADLSWSPGLSACPKSALTRPRCWPVPACSASPSASAARNWCRISSPGCSCSGRRHAGGRLRLARQHVRDRGATLDPHHPPARERWLSQYHPVLGRYHRDQHDPRFQHRADLHRGQL